MEKLSRLFLVLTNGVTIGTEFHADKIGTIDIYTYVREEVADPLTFEGLSSWRLYMYICLAMSIHVYMSMVLANAEEGVDGKPLCFLAVWLHIVVWLEKGEFREN